MIIKIKLHEDLSTPAQNALRYAIELGRWRAQWREAEMSQDHERMDRLQVDYERVGLP